MQVHVTYDHECFWPAEFWLVRACKGLPFMRIFRWIFFWKKTCFSLPNFPWRNWSKELSLSPSLVEELAWLAPIISELFWIFGRHISGTLLWTLLEPSLNLLRTFEDLRSQFGQTKARSLQADRTSSAQRCGKGASCEFHSHTTECSSFIALSRSLSLSLSRSVVMALLNWVRQFKIINNECQMNCRKRRT